MKDMLDCFELDDGCSLGIMTDNASSNYLMTHELQSTLEASGIEWPAFSNNIPCTVHVTRLALGALISSLGVKSAQSPGYTMSAISNL